MSEGYNQSSGHCLQQCVCVCVEWRALNNDASQTRLDCDALRLAPRRTDCMTVPRQSHLLVVPVFLFLSSDLPTATHSQIPSRPVLLVGICTAACYCVRCTTTTTTTNYLPQRSKITTSSQAKRITESCYTSCDRM